MTLVDDGLSGVKYGSKDENWVIALAGTPSMVSYGVLRAFGIPLGHARLPWREPDQSAIDKAVSALRNHPRLGAYIPS